MQSRTSVQDNKPSLIFYSLIFTDDTINTNFTLQKKSYKYILRIIQKQNPLACHDFYFSSEDISKDSNSNKFSFNIKVPEKAEKIYLCEVKKNSVGQSNQTKIAKGFIDVKKIMQIPSDNKKKVSIFLYGIKKQRKDQTIAILTYKAQHPEQINKDSLKSSQNSKILQNQNQNTGKQRKFNYKFVYERQKMTEISKQDSQAQDNLRNSKHSNILEDSIIQKFNKSQRNNNKINTSFSMQDRYQQSQSASQTKVKIYFPQQQKTSQRKIINNLVFFKFQGKKVINKKQDEVLKKIRVTSQQTDHESHTHKRTKLAKVIVYNSSVIPSPRNLLKYQSQQKSQISYFSKQTIENNSQKSQLISRSTLMTDSVTKGKFSIRNFVSQRKDKTHKQQSQILLPVTLNLSQSESKRKPLDRSFKIIQSPLNRKYQNRFSVGQISPRLKQIMEKNQQQISSKSYLLKIKRLAIFLNDLEQSDYYSHYDSWLFQDSFSYHVQIICESYFAKFQAHLTEDAQSSKQMLIMDQEVTLRNYTLNSSKKLIFNIIKQNKKNELSQQKEKALQDKLGTSIINFDQLQYKQGNYQKEGSCIIESDCEGQQTQTYFQKYIEQNGQTIGKYQMFYQIQKLQNILSKKKIQWKNILFNKGEINPQLKEGDECKNQKLPPLKLPYEKIAPSSLKFKKKNEKYRDTIINIK